MAVLVLGAVLATAVPATANTLTIAPTGSWTASSTNLKIEGYGTLLGTMTCPSTIGGTINANGTGQITSWTIGSGCTPSGCTASASGLPASFSLDTEDSINTSGNRAKGWITAGSLAINVSCWGTSCSLNPNWNLPFDLIEGPSRIKMDAQGWSNFASCPTAGASISADYTVTSPVGGLSVTPTFNAASTSPAGSFGTTPGSFNVDLAMPGKDISCTSEITGTVAANGTGQITQWAFSGCQNSANPPVSCTGTAVGLPYNFAIGNPWMNGGHFGLGTAPQFSFDCGTDDCTFTAPPNGLTGYISGGTPGYLSFFESPLDGGVCQGAGLSTSYDIDVPTALAIS